MEKKKSFHVLVVDRSKVSNQLRCHALTEAGHTTTSAFDGKEALTILRRKTLPDCILMNVMMPIIDGYTACQKIRKIKRLEEIPIIITSPLSGSEHEISSMKNGANGVWHITQEFAVLLKQIEDLCELQASRKKIAELTAELAECRKKLNSREFVVRNR